MERLDKFLADSGAGTRSQVRALLKAGRVTVDGAVETDGGRRIDPSCRSVCLDGAALLGRPRLTVMLNKPAGYLTATRDRSGPTVMELLPPAWKRMELRPVGRLDKQTEGLLLLTNDGQLLHRLISPRREVPKVYYARHEGTVPPDGAAAFAAGITLDDGTVCRPAVLEVLGAGESLVTVCEGKYHQVRRMLAAVGCPVTYLERRQEGPLTLDGLPRGACRALTAEELRLLGGAASGR